MKMITLYRTGVCVRAGVMAILFAVGSTGVFAQGSALTVTGDQGLQFGIVLPGLPSSVSPTDVAYAGRFQVRGDRNAEVVIQFNLPTEMVAPGGASLPMAFGVADGSWSSRPSIQQVQTFDPNIPLVAQLGSSGRLYLRLGGTAQPTSTQPQGEYSATIAVIVAYTGN